MRSRDPPTAGPGPTIASRVISSQPPLLAMAWQSARPALVPVHASFGAEATAARVRDRP